MAGYAASRRKKRSMMNRLLSRKTKTIAFGGPIHRPPVSVRRGPCDLPRNPFEVSPSGSCGHSPQCRISSYDLTLQAPIYRIRGARRGLNRRFDHSHRPPAFRYGEAFARLYPAKNAAGLILQVPHANLRVVPHVATNVATTTAASTPGRGRLYAVELGRQAGFSAKIGWSIVQRL